MNRMSRSVLCLAAGLTFLAHPAAAQSSPSGHEFRVNSYTTGEQVEPDVSVNPVNGRFIVVWKAPPSSFCKGQRFNAAGAQIGGEFFPSAACPGGIAASMFVPGGFVVATVDGPDIFARRFVNYGAFSGNYLVNTYTTGNKAGVRLASDTSGGFVVVWSGAVQDGNGFGVFARRYIYSGEPAGFLPEFRVNSNTTGDQKGPAIAMDPAGAFVVVWESALPAVCCPQIEGQRYAATGAPLGSEFRVNSNAAIGNYFPDVASDTSGNFVVAWTSSPYGAYTYDVFARRFSSSGAPLGVTFRVNTNTNVVAARPRVTRRDTDFVVVWEEQQTDGASYGVFGRRYAPDGSALGSVFRVNSYTTHDQILPAITSKPDGGFVVVWESDVQDGSMHGVYGQKYCLGGDADGNGVVDVADVFYLINYLFAGGPEPLGCADVDGSVTLDVADVFYLINFLFAHGPAPV